MVSMAPLSVLTPFTESQLQISSSSNAEKDATWVYHVRSSITNLRGICKYWMENFDATSTSPSIEQGNLCVRFAACSFQWMPSNSTNFLTARKPGNHLLMPSHNYKPTSLSYSRCDNDNNPFGLQYNSSYHLNFTMWPLSITLRSSLVVYWGTCGQHWL